MFSIINNHLFTRSNITRFSSSSSEEKKELLVMTLREMHHLRQFNHCDFCILNPNIPNAELLTRRERLNAEIVEIPTESNVEVRYIRNNIHIFRNLCYRHYAEISLQFLNDPTITNISVIRRPSSLKTLALNAELRHRQEIEPNFLPYPYFMELSRDHLVRTQFILTNTPPMGDPSTPFPSYYPLIKTGREPIIDDSEILEKFPYAVSWQRLKQFFMQFTMLPSYQIREIPFYFVKMAMFIDIDQKSCDKFDKFPFNLISHTKPMTAIEWHNKHANLERSRDLITVNSESIRDSKFTISQRVYSQTDDGLPFIDTVYTRESDGQDFHCTITGRPNADIVQHNEAETILYDNHALQINAYIPHGMRHR